MTQQRQLRQTHSITLQFLEFSISKTAFGTQLYTAYVTSIYLLSQLTCSFNMSQAQFCYFVVLLFSLI